MPKQPPAFRFLTPEAEGGPLIEIGQAWRTAKENVFSVSIDLENTGEPIRVMMMPNLPKPQQPQRQARQRGDQPAPRPAV